MSRASTAIFSSPRERRLWIGAIAVVVAIYTTLGLARPLSAMLRQRGLLEATFVLGFVLILAAIATLGLKRRPGGLQVGVALGTLAVYVMLLVRIELAEERTHLIEYGVVALFIHEALKERASHGHHVPVPAVIAVLVTALVGILDECIQGLLPDRVLDPRDMFINVAAAVMAVAASTALGWARSIDSTSLGR